jgi:hypothetical protein
VGPPLGRTASLMGRSAHYGGVSAQASSWCLLKPSRVVFHSFCGLNHMLSPVCLFGVYDSGSGLFSGQILLHTNIHQSSWNSLV